MYKLGIIAVVALLVPKLAVTEQDDASATQEKKHEWFRVVRVKYQGWKVEDARKMISEHFLPAIKEAGNPVPRLYLHVAGRWNLTAVFPLVDGVKELDWDPDPRGVKWIAALAKRLGGEDKARMMLDDYSSTITDSHVEIVRTWNP